MAPTSGPRADLASPICSDVPGTWAYSTMSDRIRTTILAKIPRENDFPECIISGLNELDEELQTAATTKLRLISDDGGPEVEHWNKNIMPPYLDSTWLSAPWLLAEFYFYRRVMEAVCYFKTGEDPFRLQKELGLSSALGSIEALAERVNVVCDSKTFSIGDLSTAVLTALWGNRMDLSIWPVGEATASGLSNARRAEEAASKTQQEADGMILSNDLDSLCSYVAEKMPSDRIDIVVDNAGFELFCDLCLADYLITSGASKNVRLQLKAHPTFVSDAMAKDVHDTVQFLIKLDKNNAAVRLGQRWQSHIDSGAWSLVEDFFWVQPNPFWQMPAELRKDLQTNSSLTFIKGDANYRRLLGDLQWPFTTPFEDIACYFPSPVCPLRTFKAELACGLSQEAVDRASQEDPNWLVSGRYGVIQFMIT